jgi:hypothetical protein
MVGATLKAETGQLPEQTEALVAPVAIMPHRSINSFSAVEIKTYLGIRAELQALGQELSDDDGRLRNALRISLDVAGQSLVCEVGLSDVQNVDQLSGAELGRITQGLAGRLEGEAKVLGIVQVDRLSEFLIKV